MQGMNFDIEVRRYGLDAFFKTSQFVWQNHFLLYCFSLHLLTNFGIDDKPSYKNF